MSSISGEGEEKEVKCIDWENMEDGISEMRSEKSPLSNRISFRFYLKRCSTLAECFCGYPVCLKVVLERRGRDKFLSVPDKVCWMQG